MLDLATLRPEITYQTARSGGSGGQNVNKVETKVELRFDVANSTVLSEIEKAILLEKLAPKLTNENVLVLYHQTERSQLANKVQVLKKFDRLLRKCFEVTKPRKITAPSFGTLTKRRETKKRDSAIKSFRKKITLDD